MPNFAANITTMFQELPMPERIQASLDCGFKATEFLFPYEWSVDEIKTWPGAGEIEFVLTNTPEPPGCASIVGSEAAFRSGFDTALAYSDALGGSMIHLMAGVPTGTIEEAEHCFMDNVRWAADRSTSKTILLEALNNIDMPGYLHCMTDHTISLIERIDRPNVKLQFDFYHQQLMEGHLATTMAKHWQHIGHVQFSSVPGRHEPQYGEVNCDYLFDWLDKEGYDGWVGCEYKAKSSTIEGLKWLEKWK